MYTTENIPYNTIRLLTSLKNRFQVIFNNEFLIRLFIKSYTGIIFISNL